MKSTPPPIELDLTFAFDFERGVGRSNLLEMSARLEAARKSLLTSTETGPDWLAAWQPKALLDNYARNRRTSELSRLLKTAARIRDAVDRVVVVGANHLLRTATTLFQTCCHPFHNELSRGERGGRPRIYFAPAAPDNDGMQALLDILPRGQNLYDVRERWGIVAMDDEVQPLVAGVFSLFCDAYQSTTEALEIHDVVAVGLSDSPIMRIAEEINCDRWVLGDGLSAPLNQQPGTAQGDCSHPGVLLAASLMGIDIVQFLQGEAAMIERFTCAPVGNNPPLDLSGCRHLLRLRRGIVTLDVDIGHSLCTPFVNHDQRYYENAHSVLLQLLVGSVRRDRLRVTIPAGETASGRTRHITKPLPEVAKDQAEAIRERRKTAGLPTATITLPAFDETAVGQLIQLLSLESALEKVLSATSDC